MRVQHSSTGSLWLVMQTIPGPGRPPNDRPRPTIEKIVQVCLTRDAARRWIVAARP